MSILKKIFFYLLIGLTVLTISLVASAFLFKDRIINRFIEAANENLSTPVKIGSIDVSVFDHFPQLSIVLNDVYVEDSHPGQYPLLTATQVSFQLNPLEVYNGEYHIKGLEVVESEANLKIDRKGENNYTIVKEAKTSNEALSFELQNVILKNAVVHYTDLSAQQYSDFASEQLSASIKNANDIYTIFAKGEVTSKKIKIENTSLFENKAFTIETHLIYNDLNRSLSIEPSTIGLKNSAFSLKGEYQWKNSPTIDLQINGNQTNLQTLLSLLPESTSGKFDQYQSKGDAYFSASLKGPITSTKNPSLTIQFGLNNATITHPDTRAQINRASVEGSFVSSNLTDLHQAELVLKNINGSLNNEPFEANLVIQDFVDSNVIFKFKGLIDTESLISFYPINEISQLSGKLQTDITFEGKLSWLKTRATAQKASTEGTVELQNLNFLYGQAKVPVKGLNGSLQFNNNDLALSNVSVQVGNSDFFVNGFFKNIITFILFENQPIGIEADLKSNYLDVDQLFAIGYGEGKSQEYIFSISPNVNLNFNCDVQLLRYKRFTARKLTGDLLVKQQVAVSRNIKLKTMGGDLELSGIVDATNAKTVNVLTTAKMNSIYLDSVFYVFKNFDQEFIQDKHLKGLANADVTFELTLNEKLKLFQETLVADISAVVKSGELNHFEPLQKLSKYVDDKGLDALRFAELKNDIHIENKTIYIPQMEVRSNVTTLQISGTHTFDQQIDYRVITPLRNKKINDIEAAKATEEQGGQLKLFLKITGTTDNYRVQYDTEAVRKKIAADLKKEVQELKDAFKNKGQKKKKELELSTEEFDWDN